MAKFEVFIPAAEKAGFDLTFRVDADNWLAALNTGMKKIGEAGGGSNLLVDIQDDNSIHVTDPKSGKVFRIRELEAATSGVLAAVAGPALAAPVSSPFDPQPTAQPIPEAPAIPLVAPVAAPMPAPIPLERRAPAKPAVEPSPKPVPLPQSVAPKSRSENPSIDFGAPPRPQASSGTPTATKPSAEAERVVELPRAETKAPAGKIGRERTPVTSEIDEVLADLFERLQALEGHANPKDGLAYVLDLAMEKLPVESGSVFLADLSHNDLSLGAVRGPKSSELLEMNPRVPMGVGIVGFCAQEGVSLALSDVQRDPRFFRAISERLGYETQSILCAAMVAEGRSHGCIEVINKKASTRFSEGELAVLNYLADQAAKYLESMS